MRGGSGQHGVPDDGDMVVSRERATTSDDVTPTTRATSRGGVTAGRDLQLQTPSPRRHSDLYYKMW